MTNLALEEIRKQPRFKGIRVVRDNGADEWKHTAEDKEKCEKQEVDINFNNNNAAKLEKKIAEYCGVRYAVAVNSDTAALHLSLRLAAEKLYGEPKLTGYKVFCQDLAPASIADPILYENGEPVFVDVSPEDWCMDPEALEIAFSLYPDVKIVIMHHLNGFPGQAIVIRDICREHGAILIEDAGSALGAKIEGKLAIGSIGDFGILSFSGDNPVGDIGGGILLMNNAEDAAQARKLIGRSTEEAPWQQCEKIGFDYKMNALAAELIANRMDQVDQYRVKKEQIYRRYANRLDDGLMEMNPVGEGTEPNYTQPAITVESSIGFWEERGEIDYTYDSRHGTASPMEIVEALQAFGVKAPPIYKPLHMQPLFRMFDQISLDGSIRDESNDDDNLWVRCNESARIFRTGVFLPCEINMTPDEQERIMDIIYACFDGEDIDRQLWG